MAKRLTWSGKIVRALTLASSLAGLVMLFSCSDDDKKSGPITCNNPSGGVVSGQADNHCGGSKTPIMESACSLKPDGGATIQSVLLHHGDASAGDGGADPGYGPTLTGNESDDDDCKYHVKWEAENPSTVCVNGDIFFRVTLTTTADGAPVRNNVPIRVEAVLDHKFPAPPTDQRSLEIAGSPGVYSVGPIRLDRPGQWMVRFHVREECGDAESSPHGHAAYFVAVP
ncbi:hypothetical protein [Pendulispora albinea]|uniref:YtkA-like domain-containing protein n=1 Tax=Pendulispora albinea TaxID=2741071 RepID=A0ABZ2LUU8_9BACT